jgi:hypothetical protein
MNTKLLHEKLIGAARMDRPSDRVPYAFEQRIMALIRTQPVSDRLVLWVHALWRAAIPCVALTLLLALWGAGTPAQTTTAETADLGTELETTLMASVTLETDLAW